MELLLSAGGEGGFLLTLQWEARCKMQLWWWLEEGFDVFFYGSSYLMCLRFPLRQRVLVWGVSPRSWWGRSLPGTKHDWLNSWGVLWVCPRAASLECSPFCSLGTIRGWGHQQCLVRDGTASLTQCHLFCIFRVSSHKKKCHGCVTGDCSYSRII